ncbi:GGDEF domain-containing protein, partial [Kurthia zopfii]
QDTPKEKAVQLASAIQMFIEKEEISEKEQNYGGITVSIGVATMDEWTSFATVNELIDAADQNLYISKKTGKNKVVF